MKERTVILVKPDGVQRGLVGEIIKRFETVGLKIAAMRLVHPTKEMADTHYTLTPESITKLGENTRIAAKAKGIVMEESNEQIAHRVKGYNVDFIASGPVVAIVFEGIHAIEIGRKLVGHTESRQASIGTIRGDFSTDSYQMGDVLERPVRNVVHASGTTEEAKHEMKVWFSENDIYDYELHSWKVMH